MYSFVKYRRRLNQPIQQYIESKEEINPKYSDVDLMSMESYLSFSWLDYLLINDDLVEHNICTKLLAFRHYIEFGQSENRETKQQYFHWVDYLIANEDLLKNGIQTKEESYFYYMKHKSENRPLKSKKFNWIHYYAIHNDLRDYKINKEYDVKQHYVEHGFKEGRRPFIPDIDVKFYIYFHCLQEHGVNSEYLGLRHWLDYGQKESRICNINDFEKEYNMLVKEQPSKKSICYDNVFVFQSDAEESYLEEKDLHIIEHRDKPNFRPLTINYDIIYNKPLQKDCILVVDFPCFGGGTSFFLNAILSKYKKTQNFIIARCFHNKYYYYLNDEEIIHYPTNLDLSLKMLDILEKNISKIFVNSFLKHHDLFIDKLFTMNKEMTTITHDLTTCFDVPHEYHHNLKKLNPLYKYRLQKFDTIITQNEENVSIYQSQWTDKQQKIIVSLPDYKYADEKIETNNEKTVIGIIGNISDVKGYYIIYKLIELVKQSQNLDLVIFGRMNVDYKKKFVYKNVKELNELMMKFSPNLIVETSLWPESYSYTLSLAMITNLPILYQNKHYNSTILNRIHKYQKGHAFSNVNELAEQDFHKVKQDYFYTIDLNIYYPTFYDAYFGKSEAKYKLYNHLSNSVNLVIVTSKIITSNKPFSYINIRSKYNSDERYEQTLKSIESIQKHIPNYYIVLFDNSDLSKTQYETLQSKVSCFIHITNNEILNDVTNNNSNKMYGEVAQTREMLNYIETHRKSLSFNHLFKLSGRYVINKHFKYKKFNNENIVMKRNSSVDREYFYTSFYKIHRSKYEVYRNAIDTIYDGISTHAYDDDELEVLFPKLLNYQFQKTESLGITQNIAVWDDTSEI